MSAQPQQIRQPSEKFLRRLRNLSPHIALIGVQILFGTWPVLGKIALREVPAGVIVMFRTLGAALFFLALQQFIPRTPLKSRADLFRLIFYSALGISANQILSVEGLSHTTVINVSVLSTMIPVFALIVAVALRRERSSLLQTGGIAVAAFGTLYLINPLQRADFSDASALGDAMIVVNCLLYGSYLALSKDVLKRYGTFTVLCWIFLFGNLLTLPFGLYSWYAGETNFAGVSTQAWLIVFYIVLFPTIGAYSLNAWALARVSPSVVAAYVYLQPLIALAVTPLVLDETLNSRTWLASALIFGGVALVTQGARRSRRRGEQQPAAEEHVTHAA